MTCVTARILVQNVASAAKHRREPSAPRRATPRRGLRSFPVWRRQRNRAEDVLPELRPSRRSWHAPQFLDFDKHPRMTSCGQSFDWTRKARGEVPVARHR